MRITTYIRSLFTPASTTEANGDWRFIPEYTDRYFRSIAPRAAGQVIDDDTSADLDLDVVFNALDRTTSRVGQQYLYARLRLPAGARPTRQASSIEQPSSKPTRHLEHIAWPSYRN